MQTKYNETTNMQEFFPDEETPEKKELTSNAEMEQAAGILGQIAKFEVMGMPLGAVAVGTASGVLIDRLLLERFVKDPTMRTWALMGGAFLVNMPFARKFLGAAAANATSFVLIYEAIADTVQGWVTGLMPGGATMPQNVGVGMGQKPAVTSGYYDWAFKRG